MQRTPIKRISDKKRQQIKEEKLLRTQLLERCQGVCEECGRAPDWRGLSMHHIVFRSHGGESTPENCIMLCGNCHDKRHGK